MKGSLTTLIDNSGTSKFYYDELGQTIKTIKTIDSNNYTTETTYDALGRTKTLTYPDSSIVNYTYDTGGNLDEVIDDATGMPYASYLNYNALGQVGQIDFGNGISTVYQYHTDNNRLFSITTNGASGLINLSYFYDNVGNITGITDHLDSTKSRSYVYDDLDRLIMANSPSYGGNLMYEYDKIGNMTRNCRYGYYHYEDTDHKHAVTRIHSNGEDVDTYAYDLNGNMTSGAGRVLTYDYDNMPETITYGGTAVVNVYDASGQRVKKVTPTSTTTYIGQGYECDQNGSCTKYIFAGSNRIAKIDSADTYFYHTDHLGSSSVMTDEDGNTEQEVYYYPYGEMKTNTGSDVAKHKFTGQEWDAEYGLYYYGARYYDPKLARFISADTIVPEPFNPQALNRYSYVLNNPIIYIDPSGHGFFSKLWKKIVKPIIAAATAFVLTGNPVVAASAAISTAVLDTGEGRKAVRSVGRYFFDNFLGIDNPKIAYMLSCITLDAAMTWGMTSTYNYFAKTPKATIGKEINIHDSKYGEFKKHAGGYNNPIYGGDNIVETAITNGKAYEILNSNGELIGVYSQHGAFVPGSEKIGLVHGAAVIKDSTGRFFNSMRGLRNFYGVTSMSHQMVNQTFLQAGYSLTMTPATIPGSGWFTYVSSLVYGPYGSAAPSLGFYETKHR